MGVAAAEGSVAVLDSKQADGDLVVTARQPWQAFVDWAATQA
ncbi:hypothetical protein ACFV6U_09175 [Streptomyces sp. NPDC059810]